MMRSTSRGGQRSKGSRIPYLFFLFFGVIIAANAALVVFASVTWPGLSSDKHYERGLAYNEVLERQAAQDALGWTVRTETNDRGKGALEIEVSLSTAAGGVLDADLVTARLLRPAVEGLDHKAFLQETGAGRYGASLTLPQPGVWDLVVTVEKGADRHFSKQRIYLQP